MVLIIDVFSIVDDNQLSGTIPGEIGELSNLADLNLGKRHQHDLFTIKISFYYNICVFITIFVIIICLFFVFIFIISAENNFSGEIPTKFGDLRNLIVLDLREYLITALQSSSSYVS